MQSASTDNNSTTNAAAARAIQAKAVAAYGVQSRQAQEEGWILKNLPLVRHIVQKVAAQFTNRDEIEELISVGTLGLVKAARAYDSSRDAEFRTYAYIRIRGAVIDELRSRSFIPPAVHNQIRMMQEAYRQFAAVHSRPPADEELAVEMSIPVETLYTLMEEARRQHFLCIHGMSDEASVLEPLMPLDRAPSVEDQAARKEMAERLAKAIMALPQRDRHILLLYYERDLTMKEIAHVLEITEPRVSQLHASALMKLTMLMKESPVARSENEQ